MRVGDPDWGLPQRAARMFCHISGGGSGSSGSSKQKSSSGVSRPNRDKATDRLFDLIGGLLPEIQAFGKTPPQLDLNPTTGLTTQQQGLASNLVQEGVKNQFNQLSAGGALRGQTSVKNTSSILGSAAERAATAVLPQTLGISGENTRFNTMAPGQQQAQAFSFIQNLGQLLAALTQGSEGKGSASQSSFGFNFGALN